MRWTLINKMNKMEMNEISLVSEIIDMKVYFRGN